MNKVILCGGITKDPEVRWTSAQNSVDGQSQCIARYTLAVNRKDKDRTADFIRCVAFGKSGEFAEKYLHKGTKILIVGHILTGSYTNRDGQKVYTTEVAVDEHEFVGPKETSQNAPQSPQSAQKPQTYQQSGMDFGSAQAQQGWMEVSDEGLPWS